MASHTLVGGHPSEESGDALEPSAADVAITAQLTCSRTARVLEKAPKASGVYSIFTAKRWVYVGESDDIQRSLFNRLNRPTACLQRYSPLSFSFAVALPSDRKANWTR